MSSDFADDPDATLVQWVPGLSEHATAAGSYCFVGSDGQALALFDDDLNAEVDQDFQIGATIHERYLLTANLGRGGMGRVLLAHDQLLNRQVAMKIVAVRWQGSAKLLQEALAREARLGASLNDPGIATVFDFGIHAGKSFTIFEYVDGQTLREILQRCHQLPLTDVRRIIAALAISLDFAHSQGVIHRDLKPENICIARNGQPRILDFGIARDLREEFKIEGFCGTAQYASPEQASCSAVDGRTDQYALALLAYEMLAGRKVFHGKDPQQLLQLHCESNPVSLCSLREDLPEEVGAAIHRALHKVPSKRFATCQEFAMALQGNQAEPAFLRTLSTVPLQEQIAAYVCGSGDDSLLASQLATYLGKQGFSTWYYQRDALPGISFLTQTTEAIRRSGAFIILISHQTLRSEEAGRQIQEAARCSIVMMPLLIGMTLEEFESHHPVWRSLLGTASIIAPDRNQPEHTFERVAVALTVVGLQPGEIVVRPPDRPLRSLHGQIWATDASQIDVHDLQQVVFRNQIVEEFLNRRSKFFLSATKGLGKTLLLTYKRHLLSQLHAREHASAGLCFIPQGRPYLDFMSELKSLSARFEKPLADLSTTKRFWTMALRVSALANHPGIIAADEEDELAVFPPRFRRWLKGSRIEPTVVFRELTNLSISQANALVDDTETFLDQKLRGIHSSTYFFIDKVDQAVRRLSRDAWINIQAGLIEAAWDMMSANSHAKIFASIRHEAFVNYQSDIKSNLTGATAFLRYSDDELEELLDRLSSCYEATSDFKDFLGIRVLKHERRPVPEDSFRFIRRHSFGRPRDLVVIAAELSAQRTSLTETKFCEVVRRASANRLVANLFEENRMFLDCLDNRETRSRFLASLPANILSRQEAVSVCARFNGISEETVNSFGDAANEIFHPFQDLYLAGLLGVVWKLSDGDLSIQKFRQPDDMVSHSGADLPLSAWYFLHPALCGFVRETRMEDDFLFYEHVIVGDQLPWESYDAVCCQIERCTAAISSVEIRQLIHRILKRAREVLRSSNPRNLPVVLQSLPEWPLTLTQLQKHGFDDALLWLDELKSFTENRFP